MNDDVESSKSFENPMYDSYEQRTNPAYADPAYADPNNGGGLTGYMDVSPNAGAGASASGYMDVSPNKHPNTPATETAYMDLAPKEIGDNRGAIANSAYMAVSGGVGFNSESSDEDV